MFISLMMLTERMMTNKRWAQAPPLISYGNSHKNYFRHFAQKLFCANYHMLFRRRVHGCGAPNFESMGIFYKICSRFLYKITS